MHPLLFEEILIILAGGLVAGLLCRFLRLPVLTGYLCVGILLGQSGLGWVTDEQHQLEYFAEAGVFLLLFAIGLEFALDDLSSLLRNMILGGGFQMLCVALPVAGLMMAAGQSWQAAWLVGAACSFSSTVLVFKALSTFGHSALPHGQRAIAILLFQDAALIPLLLIVPLLSSTGAVGAEPPQWTDYMGLLVSSGLFLSAIVALRYWVARLVLPFISAMRSVEMSLLFALFALGSITWVSFKLGLPPAVGAFAAGIVFNGNRWSHQIEALLLPFRETFAAIFFIGLGLLLDTSVLAGHGPALAWGLAGLIALKAVAGAIACRLTGVSWKLAAGTGLGLAHIGEFAFVLATQGWYGGVLSEVQYQFVVALAVCSLVVTPLLLQAGLKWSGPRPSVLEDSPSAGAAMESKNAGPAIVKTLVVGAGPVGKSVASQLELQGHSVCLLDRNPINLQPFALHGFHTIAGEATDWDTLNLVALNELGLAAVCVPEDHDAVEIVRMIRQANRQATIAVRCRYLASQRLLTKAGADLVIAEEAQAAKALIEALPTGRAGT